METPLQAGAVPGGAVSWTPRPLPIVGGHPALDFANTVDDPLGPLRWDHIADYAALLTWSQRIGLLPDAAADRLRAAAADDRTRSAQVVSRAAELRASLNELFGAVVDGRSPADGWAGLVPLLTEAMDHSLLDRSDVAAAVTWAFDELASPLWPVAHAAHQLVTSPDVTRIKRCAGCPWLFLDLSRNHSRRWCAMEDCGTHAKIRRYVERRAARRG